MNSDHISDAAPCGKNLLQERVSEVTASKCRCLNLQPSGPGLLQRVKARKYFSMKKKTKTFKTKLAKISLSRVSKKMDPPHAYPRQVFKKDSPAEVCMNQGIIQGPPLNFQRQLLTVFVHQPD